MTSSSSSSPEISSAPTADAQRRFSYKHATHDEVLEDLSSRFILNLPDEELASLERICFQVEQAHWFYEDFVREENPKFPSLPLKKFSAMLFHACPLLHQWSHDHEQAFNTFMQYKTRVPVCGAIMLNDTWEKCILVKGWKSSSGWGFPKGKINEDEAPHNCAIREVLEETGYNLAGQVNTDDVIQMSIKEQKISLYIVPGVPEDYPFKTRTRKEISRIEWFNLTDLPTWKRNKAAPGKFYLISPFIGPLKAFINERKHLSHPRKGLAVKDLRIYEDSTAIERQSPALSSLTTYQDGSTQESSSQSSSADNGDPQTPSPQYTESLPNPINGIVAPTVIDDTSISQALSSNVIDPHFARLLNSLSMSAVTPLDNNADKLLAPSSTIPLRDTYALPSSTPQATAVDSHSNSLTADHANQSTCAAARSSERSLSSPCLSSSTIHPLNSVAPSLASSHSFRHRPLPINAHGRDSPSVPIPAGPPSATLSTTSSATSSMSPSLPRKSSSQHNSSAADISPYLTRPSEVPTSGKRLKQLALLESVADESTRMSPALSSPIIAMNGGQPPSAFRFASPHTPSSVSHPYGLSNNDANDLRVIYSSVPPNGSYPQSTRPQFAAPVYDDPFQVRPRTSHTYRHLVPSRPPQAARVSMNQSQLLSLLPSPSGPNPRSAPSGDIRPSQGPALMIPPQLHVQTPPQYPIKSGYGPPLGPRVLSPPQTLSAPLNATTLTPGFNLSSVNIANKNPNLLSILNGKQLLSSTTRFAGPGGLVNGTGIHHR